MKNFNLIIVIMMILFSALSCNSDNVTTVGGITVSISDAISRGINPNISLDVASYSVKGEGPNNQEFSATLSSSEPTYTNEELLPGSWKVVATAYNPQGKAIGSGTVYPEVKAGRNTEVPITVSELAGSGTVNILLEVPTEDEYRIDIESVTNGLLYSYKTETLTATNGKIETSYSLPNGYYRVRIVCYNVTVRLPSPVAFRVVNDDTLSISLTASYMEGRVTVEINDTIVETPVLTITATQNSVSKNESVTVNATAEGNNLGFQWYVDGIRNSSESSNVFTTLFTESGSHEICCLAIDYDTKIVTSSKTTVTVTE